MAGNTATSDDLLKLNGIRQRKDSYTFDLLDNANTVVGSLQPSRDSSPVIGLNTDAKIFRTLTGLFVDSTRQISLDTISARVRANLVLQNGAVYPLGVFLFGDATRPRRSWGLELNATLMDASYILDQDVGRVVGYAAGTNAVAAALALAQEVIATPAAATASGTTLGAPLAFKPTDTRQTIINKLLAAAAYLPVYFDNNGNLIMRPVPTLPAASPDFDYEAGGRIVKDSIVESDDLLTAPNRYIVIDTSATSAAAVGSYDLPASAPNSIANRGFAVPKVIEIQGVGSSALATLSATAIANSDPRAFKQVTFDSTHEPRHDAFNIVQLLGFQYREIGWSVTLRAGARMKHSLRRVYS